MQAQQARPIGTTRPTPVLWSCVVELDQGWRETQSGVLYEVVKIAGSEWDAAITLRPVGGRKGEEVTIDASKLCGGAEWTRLPEDGDTTFWAGSAQR